jgi:hypothetical protein
MWKTFGTDISSLIFSVHIINFDSLWQLLVESEKSNINVLARAMDSIEVALFSALGLSQTIGVLLQLKILFLLTF